MRAVMCSRGRPCRYWRTCTACERSRQRRIADDAELLLDEHGRDGVGWVILYAGTIEGARGLLEEARAVFGWAAGVWTLERSSTGGVHLNALVPWDECIEVAPWREGVRLWVGRVRGDVRHVGAYIGKARQAISAEAMAGAHSSGKWGLRGAESWRVRVGEWRGLAGRMQSPLEVLIGARGVPGHVAAAALAMREGVGCDGIYAGVEPEDVVEYMPYEWQEAQRPWGRYGPPVRVVRGKRLSAEDREVVRRRILDMLRRIKEGLLKKMVA